MLSRYVERFEKESLMDEKGGRGYENDQIFVMPFMNAPYLKNL